MFIGGVVMLRRFAAAVVAAIICAFSLSVYAEESRRSRFTATFIQNWYCRDWTQERWNDEFRAASDAGFEALILQSCFDIVRGEPDGSRSPQDVSAYPDAQSFCMFPSSYPATWHSSQNSGDALALALSAAKINGMQLWIGTVNDDIWWKYGWGMPDSDGNGSTYLESWSEENAGLCAGLIREIQEHYGEDYGEQIAGYYYVNEIWNIDTACAGTDGGEYARIIGSNIRATVEAAGDKPVMISPFWNPDVSSPEGFTAFLSSLIDSAGFRSKDIYAPQDGGGKEYSTETMREWAEAQKAAVGGSMRFMINNETFGLNMTAKPIDELRRNYAATAGLAEGNILFSWSHYYAQDEELSRSFAAFNTERAAGDVNGDGVTGAADLVCMERFLLGCGYLVDWQAGDLIADGVIDTFDIVKLRELITD